MDVRENIPWEVLNMLDPDPLAPPKQLKRVTIQAWREGEPITITVYYHRALHLSGKRKE